MRSESLLSATPPGAGRLDDYAWPPPAGTYFSAATSGIYGRTQYRSPGNVATGFFPFNTGVGEASGPAVVAGCPVYSLTSTGATARGTGAQFRMLVPIPMTAMPLAAAGAGFIGSAANNRQVLRAWANLIFPAAPALDSDLGLEFSVPANGNSATILTDGIQGFGWTRRASGKVSVIVSGPSGTAFHDAATPVGFDPTVLNAYEFRIQAATQAAPTTLTALINGAPMFTDTWAVGTDLPVYNAAVGMFQMTLVNFAGGATNLHCQCVRWMIAPTVQDTF